MPRITTQEMPASAKKFDISTAAAIKQIVATISKKMIGSAVTGRRYIAGAQQQ